MKIKLSINQSTDTISGAYSSGHSEISLPERPTKVILDKLKNKEKQSLGFLPPAIRWISDNQRIIVFERPPSIQYVELAFAKKDYITSDTTVKGFNLPIPWTVYYVMFDECYNPVLIRVYCRNEPLYDWSDSVYMIPLLNLYYNSNLCNPVFEVYEPSENLSTGIQQAYNMVWNSGWNLDLQDAVNHCMRRGIPSSSDDVSHYFQEWEKISLVKILQTQWDRPKAQVNGEDFPEDVDVTFKTTLDHFCKEAGSVYGMNPREMMVKIINSFS